MLRPTERTSHRPMRRDIQLLRALAVALVVGYHIWPSGVPGGDVGVDLFFVISGFLIISGLVDEFRATGRFGLGAFGTRRIKRLLSAALLVLAVTFAATLVILPGSQQPEALKELITSRTPSRRHARRRSHASWSVSAGRASSSPAEPA